MAKINEYEVMARLTEGDVITAIDWSKIEIYYYLGLFENEKDFCKKEINPKLFDKINEKYDLVAYCDDNGFLNYKI